MQLERQFRHGWEPAIKGGTAPTIDCHCLIIFCHDIDRKELNRGLRPMTRLALGGSFLYGLSVRKTEILITASLLLTAILLAVLGIFMLHFALQGIGGNPTIHDTHFVSVVTIFGTMQIQVDRWVSWGGTVFCMGMSIGLLVFTIRRMARLRYGL